MQFELQTPESAPDAVKSDLETAQQNYGTIPNLYRGLATAPAALKVYLAMNQALQDHGVLTPVEQQVVYLTASAENGCTYCVAAHSVLAEMAQMPPTIRGELRARQALSDAKLDALRQFTQALIRHRGWVPEADQQAFAAAGYDQRHIIETITIVAQKTLSNYYNHLAQTPLDTMFASQAWKPGE